MVEVIGSRRIGIGMFHNHIREIRIEPGIGETAPALHVQSRTAQAGAVQVHAHQIPIRRRSIGRLEEHPLLGFVHPVERSHIVRARGQQRAFGIRTVHREKIQMVVAVLFGSQQHLGTVLEEIHIVGNIHVGRIALLIDQTLPALRGHRPDAPMVLMTVQGIDQKFLAGRFPENARDVLHRISLQVRRRILARCQVVEPKAHFRIAFARLGILVTVGFGIKLAPNGHLVFLQSRLIEPQIGNRGGSRIPSVGLGEGELFFINPVGMPVSNLVDSPVGGHLHFLARNQIPVIKIVVPQIGDLAPVRTEGHFLDFPFLAQHHRMGGFAFLVQAPDHRVVKRRPAIDGLVARQ